MPPHPPEISLTNTATSAGEPPGSSIDSLVDATPDTRDRYVDFLRALAIVVVVLWHWVFSITQWDQDGALAMPNPIGGVPGLWVITWVLQIMPVFFFVGGYANLASHASIERDGRGAATFIRSRLHRLLKPVGVFVGIWIVGELLARAISPTYPGVLQWGLVVFVPLWFLGVYAGAVVATPMMIWFHRKAPVLTMVVITSGIGIFEVIRLRAGSGWVPYISSSLVWLFVHQLGFFWRDGTFTHERGTARSLVLAGLSGLMVLTNLGTYPRSMVSLQGESSNLFPTTPCVAALATFQLGLVLWLRPVVSQWLQRRGPWKFTVSLNAVAMTIFCWHMTALVGAIGIYTMLGGSLMGEATGSWWMQRPLWLILPGVLLALLVAVFSRIEVPRTSKPPSHRPVVRH